MLETHVQIEFHVAIILLKAFKDAYNVSIWPMIIVEPYEE